MDLEDDGPGRRRRGPELEQALLTATWQELVEHGYDALTYDSVARRAGTSRPVLYRRWATKPDLVLASVTAMLRRDFVPPPDTGSLRGDLLTLLRNANNRRMPTSAVALSYLGSYFQQTGTSPADLRQALGLRPDTLDLVIDRAIARGEVDPERLTPRIRRVAVDLFRHEALMTLRSVPDEVLVEIVDDIFLPLVSPEPHPPTLP